MMDKQTNRQTDKQTNRMTDSRIYLYRCKQTFDTLDRHAYVQKKVKDRVEKRRKSL